VHRHLGLLHGHQDEVELHFRDHVQQCRLELVCGGELAQRPVEFLELEGDAAPGLRGAEGEVLLSLRQQPSHVKLAVEDRRVRRQSPGEGFAGGLARCQTRKQTDGENQNANKMF